MPNTLLFDVVLISLLTVESLTFRDNRCVRQCREVIADLIELLHWKTIVILFSEDNLVSEFVTYLEGNRIDTKITLMDFGDKNRTQMKKILELSYKISPDGYVLFHSESNMDFLTILNGFDLGSNKTTDFRIGSQWILVNHDAKNTSPWTFEWQLRHVSILQFKRNFCELFTVVGNQNVKKVTCLEVCSVGDIFPNINYKLNGRHLKIGTIYSTLHMIHKIVDGNNKSSFGGGLADLTSVMAQVLNFTYSIVQPEDREYGRKLNGSWTGLVGELVNQKVDMVIAEMTITEDRLQVVDFILPAFHIQELGILFRKSDDLENKWTKLFRPLQSPIYLCLIEICIFLGVLLYAIDNEVFHSVTRIRMMKMLSTVTDMVGFLSMNANGLRSRKDSSRILIAFLWMFSIVISASYVGNLTAKLMENVEAKPFKSLDELVRLPDWKWGLSGGGYTRQLMANAITEPYTQVWEGIKKFNQTDPMVLDAEYDRHIAKILNPEEKYALILIDPRFAMLKSKHCQFEIIENIISTLSLAIAVPKNSYLKKYLETTMMTLSDNGFLQNFVDNLYKDERPNMCKIPSERRPMRLNDLYGLVLVFLVGILSAIVVLVCECYLKNHSRIGH